MTISPIIRSWLYLISLIPSILVSIFNLYHLLKSRAVRTAVNNHVIILLLGFGLFVELTDCVWQIHLNRTGRVLSATPAFCYIWVICGTNGPILISILMAWASIERHLIVFKRNFFALKNNRILFHYVPLTICILWPTTFYLIMLIILPCNVSFSATFNFCNRYACILRFRWVSLFDSVAHYILPAFVTSIFSVALLVRSILKRYRARGQVDWRNYKKMAAQLLPLSALYVALQLPPMLLYAAYSAGVSRNVARDYYSDAFFFSYWVILLAPFVSVLSLQNLNTKLRNLLFWRPTNAVRPIAQRNAVQPIAQRNAVQPIAQRNAVQPIAQRNAGKTAARVPVAAPVAAQPVEVPVAAQPVEVPVAAQPVEVPPPEVESVNETPTTEAPIVNPPFRIIPVQVIPIAPLTPVEI